MLMSSSTNSEVRLSNELIMTGHDLLAFPMNDLEKAVLNNETVVTTQKNRWRVIC